MPPPLQSPADTKDRLVFSLRKAIISKSQPHWFVHPTCEAPGLFRPISHTFYSKYRFATLLILSWHAHAEPQFHGIIALCVLFKLHESTMKQVSQWFATTPCGKRSKPATAAPDSSEQGETAAFGLEELASGGENPKADIVFVHGLRGKKLGTWSRDGFCWPRDLLPKEDDMTEVRVFAFGWDASVANVTSYASQDSLFGHAGNLLNDLESVRGDKKHPIFFIAHSLGGLLVKQMLIKASSYHLNNQFGSLGNPILHTKGIIFMGTPHQGSDATKYAELVVRVVTAILRQPNSQLVEALRRDSAILENQRSEFVTVSKDLDVVCFREELPTEIGLIVPKDTAVYAGFKVREGGIYANHRDMTKFSSDKDEGYKRVLHQVRRQIKENSVANQTQILRTLWFKHMRQREETIDPAFNKTCDWLFAQSNDVNAPVERLKLWLSSNSESIFWISGKAGSGKSTLMKFLHENIQNLNHAFINHHTIVASFFFYKTENKDFELQMSREGMMRSILHQCLEQERTWIPDVIPELFGEETSYKDIDTYLKTRISNWAWLHRAFSNLLSAAERHRRNILLLIDGLDEYRILQHTAQYTQKELELLYDSNNDDEQWGYSKWIYDGYAELINLLDTFQNNAFVKACVSSRELYIFESRFRKKPQIRLQEHTDNDIVHYCKTRLKQEALDLKASGVLVTLSDALIDHLPEKLGGRGGLYWHMVEQIPRDELRHASRMLYIMEDYGNSLDHERINLLQLDCAAHIVSTEGSPPSPPDASELETLRENVILFMTRPDDDDDALFALKRQLQSHCIGLLETQPTENRAQRWVKDVSWQKIAEHGISRIETYGVVFMHSTARDFLRRDFVQRRLKRESFNKQHALVYGTLYALRKNNRLFARWLLARHSNIIKDHLSLEQGEVFFSVFENINEIIRTTRKGIADYFDGQSVALEDTSAFWFPADTFDRCKVGGKATADDIDDLTMAVITGYRTYLESRLNTFDEQSRSKKATDLLIEHLTPVRPSWPFIWAPSELTKVLLRHGAAVNPEITMTVLTESHPGSGVEYPQWTTLPVWTYVLGCTWRTHLEVTRDSNGRFSFRISENMLWIKPALLSCASPGTREDGDFDISKPEERLNFSGIIQPMLDQGAQTDLELKFSHIVEDDSEQRWDPAAYQEGEEGWHWNSDEGWSRWEDVGTLTASEIVLRLKLASG
ncbi:hypothetical protein PG997_010632 [Apiospora hydei]|uniref:DUF676 domain-containing protein n=1 Tax=Apiospora hydei TaxID=1337664 RepID=A0ABR1VKG0_9PEZI